MFSCKQNKELTERVDLLCLSLERSILFALQPRLCLCLLKAICLYLSVWLWVAVTCDDAICPQQRDGPRPERHTDVRCLSQDAQACTNLWSARAHTLSDIHTYTYAHTQSGRPAARIGLILPLSPSLLTLMSPVEHQCDRPVGSMSQSGHTHTLTHKMTQHEVVSHQSTCQRVGLWQQ